jgi:hypothetical protein
MRLPHFRVRTLMLAVGVVALLIWGGMTGTRSYVYYTLAREYGANERGWRKTAARDRGWAKFGSECAEYYAQLARKYRRAMWRPWMPVAPDPHAPGFDQWIEQERRAKEIVPDPLPPGVMRLSQYQVGWSEAQPHTHQVKDCRIPCPRM